MRCQDIPVWIERLQAHPVGVKRQLLVWKPEYGNRAGRQGFLDGGVGLVGFASCRQAAIDRHLEAGCAGVLLLEGFGCPTGRQGVAAGVAVPDVVEFLDLR